MRNFVNRLIELDLLRVINEPVDVELEMAHIAYIEVKKQDAKALLFTRPMRQGRIYEIPVLMNLFGSPCLVAAILGDVERLAENVGKLLRPKPPKSMAEGRQWLGVLWQLAHIFPKRTRGRGLCHEVIRERENANLYELPILKTWEKDAAPFITMGQVYAQSLDGKVQNLGMYRLQLRNERELALHWQIHKDSVKMFESYREAGQKMPVSVALGGDPLYTWCATAPLPYGIFELLLYGYIRQKRARLVRCVSNPLYVPHDADIVIEGWVDVNRLEPEGPFGDHTGFYTPIEDYPVLEVSAITRKQNPIYPATVVGKPPLEDKFLGYPTERIFLPLLRTTAPELIDYYMPENGVFHNLILAQIAPLYPSHAEQIMHALWGVGQMSFVKHAIFVGKDAPSLRESEAITRFVLARLAPQRLLLSHGVCDALDHASEGYAHGGKLGIDCTGEVVADDVARLDDSALLEKMRALAPEVCSLRQIFVDTPNPIALVGVRKTRALRALPEILAPLLPHLRIVAFFDDCKLDLDNQYMNLWRAVNSIDALRDVWVREKSVFVDCTDKGALEGYGKEWAIETDCTESVIQSLRARGLIDVDDAFLRAFQICSSIVR